VVTSNHIHLLVHDTDKDLISDSIHLVAGAVGQAYNRRKGRKGAFWEDRYQEIQYRLEGYIDEVDWSQSIAVGDEGFVENFKSKLLSTGDYRKLESENETFSLKEGNQDYGKHIPSSNEIPYEEDSLEPTF